MNSHSFFTQTKTSKLFRLAAFPGAIGMIASSIYQLFDGIFVGHFLGETAFAALNLAMPFVIINFALADLIGVGASVPISILLGQKKNEEASNIFSAACLMIVGTGVVMGAVLYAAAPTLMQFMGADGVFADLAVQYLRVNAVCSPLTTMVFAADNYLRICGRIKTSMFLNIFMSVFSVVMEFVFLGVLQLGLWAAAFSTCIGMFTAVFIAMIIFARGKQVLRFCRPKFSTQMAVQIIGCGTPNFLSNIAGRITSIVFNLLLVRLGGETAVSVYGILMYAEGFVQPLLYGMCDSLQPAIGYNWGAGLYSRVRSIEKYCLTAAAIVSGVAAAILFMVPKELALLFMKNPTEDALVMAITAIRIFSLSFVTRWISFAVQSFMLAIEKSAGAAVISISVALIFPLVLVPALWPMGLTGIWLNPTLTAAFAAVLALTIIFYEKKVLFRADATAG